jgi:hypothetical protein
MAPEVGAIPVSIFLSLARSLSVIKSLGRECEMISYIMGASAGQCA